MPSSLVYRGAIAAVVVGMILAWAVLDLDVSWLAFGSGLISGNLLGFLLRPVRSWSVKRELILASWILFAAAWLGFILQADFLSLFAWGAWLATLLNFAGIRADEVSGSD